MSDEATSEAPAPSPPAAKAPAPRSRAFSAVLRVTAGLALGAAIAEIGFSVRDHGAFPHLNLYKPDPVLGVRLIPGSSMALSFGGNPVTKVRINSDGFRGADLPPPAGDEVLVVGDSQVFGLGVEEDETFSKKLEGELKGTHVINAGVPTYGPPEYDRVLEAMLRQRRPKRVLYVVNFVNDLFEAERPNAERHAVWDGWAVRKETAPTHVAGFPFRDTLFRKSHAVFALRRWWYRRGGPVETFSTPSEGTLRDIGAAAARAAEEHVRARESEGSLAKLQSAKVSVTNSDLYNARDRFMELVNQQQITTENVQLGWGTRWNPLRAAFAQPGDIVGRDDTGEYTAPLFATAEIILKGAEVRKQIEAKLRERAAKDAGDKAKIEPVLSAIESAQKRADAVRSEVVPKIRAWSPLAPGLRKVKALCDEAGAKLFVVALPMDVQVSQDEWAKHDSKPIDMEPARVLVDDLIDAAEDAGATAIDLTGVLRAAEPGAFLKRDIHLSPKGHEAVAKALAEALNAPPAPKLTAPAPGRPIGRTPPTPLSAARERKEIQVFGSTAAGCETYLVDEWLTLRCHNRGEEKAVPNGFLVKEVPYGEAVVYWDSAGSGPPALVVQVPVLRDFPTGVLLQWPAYPYKRLLQVTWGGGGTAKSKEGSVNISLWVDPSQKTDLPAPPKPSEAACAAVKAAGITRPCTELPLFENPACYETFKGDPKAVVACLQGEIAPACGRGLANVGVFQRCLPLCSKEAPCKQGKCTAYAGAEVCL